MRKAVFFDIDGTIWDYENVIPESTTRGIRKLRENGHLAFLCSGRSRAFIIGDHLFAIGFDGIVAGCGTHIEGKDGEMLFSHTLTTDEVKAAVDVVRRHNMPTILEGPEHLYMDREEFLKDPYGRKVMEIMGEKMIEIKDAENQWVVNKFSSSLPYSTTWREAIEELSDRYTPLVHGEQAAEFVPKGFSKATGIAKVCELFDVDRADTFCFGDGVNDIEMLEFVGTGVAMGNAVAEAKEAADFVTADLKEDGLYKGLEHFGLI